ncbi:hypothetical protein C485_06595 [Natrinema altunense JCM 12890]|uniref:Uncharacterized protein n=1 Tax=Natrinema altunense (strain JCM 12890 / CGMCC 1.3731 / AJ2) TaxID=1227494 RepID=L9ZSJ9_NATA2|nr:hypothetical protein C485_06595 [Natrinema altunense JCM 12890]
MDGRSALVGPNAPIEGKTDASPAVIGGWLALAISARSLLTLAVGRTVWTGEQRTMDATVIRTRV